MAGSGGHLGRLKAQVRCLGGHIGGSCGPSWGHLRGLGSYHEDFPGYVRRSRPIKQNKLSSYGYLRGFEGKVLARRWHMVGGSAVRAGPASALQTPAVSCCLFNTLCPPSGAADSRGYRPFRRPLLQIGLEEVLGAFCGVFEAFLGAVGGFLGGSWGLSWSPAEGEKR